MSVRPPCQWCHHNHDWVPKKREVYFFFYSWKYFSAHFSWTQPSSVALQAVLLRNGTDPFREWCLGFASNRSLQWFVWLTCDYIRRRRLFLAPSIRNAKKYKKNMATSSRTTFARGSASWWRFTRDSLPNRWIESLVLNRFNLVFKFNRTAMNRFNAQDSTDSSCPRLRLKMEKIHQVNLVRLNLLKCTRKNRTALNLSPS